MCLICVFEFRNINVTELDASRPSSSKIDRAECAICSLQVRAGRAGRYPQLVPNLIRNFHTHIQAPQPTGVNWLAAALCAVLFAHVIYRQAPSSREHLFIAL